jgi:aminoglycoside phosphotransferase family enzyme
MSRVNCEWQEEKKVVSEVLRKYDVRVCVRACVRAHVKYDDFSDTTTPGHNSTNLEAEFFFFFFFFLN